MAKLEVQLSAKQRAWFQPAFVVLYIACAMVSFVSWRAAGWLGDKGCAFLAARGVDIIVAPKAEGLGG